jgi:hypothetical protein
MRLGAKLLRRCILPLVRETDSIIYEAFDFTARQRLGAVLRMKTKKSPVVKPDSCVIALP